MLKPLAIGACLAMLSACASTPTTPAKPQTAAATLPAGCVGQSATRIPVKPGECAGFGSTYTQQDIQNTGQVYVDKALGMLDPAVRVGH